MTKRTNKTDHVLNLLAGASKKEEEQEGKAPEKKRSQPPVDPLQQKSSVSVMHTSTSEEDPIAGTIRDTLEKELQDIQPLKHSVRETKKAEPAEESAKKDTQESMAGLSQVMEIPEEPAEVPVEESAEVPVEEPGAVPAEVLVEEPAEVPVEEPGEVPAEGPVEVSAEEPIVEAEAEPVKEKAQPEKDYEFVNVMERLVRDKAIGYMKQFGNCTCDRCVEDTVALALTHLPSKCVVVNKAAVSPLLNFYTNKYAGQITVEITKACIVVNSNPCH